MDCYTCVSFSMRYYHHRSLVMQIEKERNYKIRNNLIKSIWYGSESHRGKVGFSCYWYPSIIDLITEIFFSNNLTTNTHWKNFKSNWKSSNRRRFSKSNNKHKAWRINFKWSVCKLKFWCGCWFECNNWNSEIRFWRSFDREIWLK